MTSLRRRVTVDERAASAGRSLGIAFAERDRHKIMHRGRSSLLRLGSSSRTDQDNDNEAMGATGMSTPPDPNTAAEETPRHEREANDKSKTKTTKPAMRRPARRPAAPKVLLRSLCMPLGLETVTEHEEEIQIPRPETDQRTLAATYQNRRHTSMIDKTTETVRETPTIQRRLLRAVSMSHVLKGGTEKNKEQRELEEEEAVLYGNPNATVQRSPLLLN